MNPGDIIVSVVLFGCWLSPAWVLCLPIWHVRLRRELDLASAALAQDRALTVLAGGEDPFPPCRCHFCVRLRRPVVIRGVDVAKLLFAAAAVFYFVGAAVARSVSLPTWRCWCGGLSPSATVEVWAVWAGAAFFTLMSGAIARGAVRSLREPP